MSLDFGRFDAMTFDCYGTLIDWERGILAALDALLAHHDGTHPPDELLAMFARHESRVEAGRFRSYRDVLAEVASAIAGELRAETSADRLAQFGRSVEAWPAFDDSAPALSRLATRFRLGVITNCDDDLFAASQRRLGVRFDPVVTAQQVGSYKPDKRNFEAMFERLALPRERILHVAQSIYHDHVPAKELGLTTVWVDRRRGQAGGGATLPASAEPDLTVPDVATLAELATGESAPSTTATG